MWDFIRRLLGLPKWKRSSDQQSVTPVKEAPPAVVTLEKVDEYHTSFSFNENLTTLPEGIQTSCLVLTGCSALKELPTGLVCEQLEASGTGLLAIPDDVQVTYRMDLTSCTQLHSLPEKFKIDQLFLRNCTSLTALPNDLDVYVLDISGCSLIREWPKRLELHAGRLIMNNCPQFENLPPGLKRISQLEIAGCIGIRELPEDLVITSRIDLGGSGITRLPPGAANAEIRWRGVRIDERTAFRPDEITAAEVLAETNVERRRILVERMGYEKFMQEAKVKIVHKDTDPGGERRLLRVPMASDEDLVCLSCTCPSTGRKYMLRVPPAIKTCHEAAAWIAGFDNADDYKPVVET